MQADERAYVLRSGVEDIEMAVETDDDEEDAVLDELGGEYLACSSKLLYHYYYSSDEDEDEDDATEGSGPPAGLQEGRNSQLTVGYKGDRSYVVRGDKIGVFRLKPDDVEYVASIANITDMKGKKFDPKNVRSIFNTVPSACCNARTGHATQSRLQDDCDEPQCTELTIPPRYRTREDR